MKVLIACEESQTVCKAFREKGHESYSCDIIDCSGGHPEWQLRSGARRKNGIKNFYRNRQSHGRSMGRKDGLKG